MAAINKQISPAGNNAHEVRQHNWNVMKPFIKFSLAALGIIGYALVSIIRHIPKPEHHTDVTQNKPINR